MLKKVLLVFVALLALGSVFDRGVAAQAGNDCTVAFGNYWTLFGGCPPGAITVNIEGPTLATCLMWSFRCPPVAAPAETCTRCLAAGNPINLASGNTYIDETDIRIPGLSNGLMLMRTWNSMWPATQSALQIGLFGPNWRSTYEERVFVGSDNYIKYGRGDGSFWSFGFNAGHWSVAAPANVTANLSWGSSYWTLTFQNGEQRLFDVTSGKLISIIDRNGNTTQLSYDSLDRLVTVTDPVSRHLYFSYGGGGNYLVTAVTSDVGVSTSYSYDSQGRLIQVTEPDLSTLSFQYNSQSLITAVTDSDGTILETHTYDSSARGLTSSRANGVEAVTVSY
jgi:YD repeat-containing protein